MLTEDVTLTMPPRPTWFDGRADVEVFFRRIPLAPGRRWRAVPTSASGQVAVMKYAWNDERGDFAPHGVNVLTLRGEKIAGISAFLGTVTPDAG